MNRHATAIQRVRSLLGLEPVQKDSKTQAFQPHDVGHRLHQVHC